MNFPATIIRSIVIAFSIIYQPSALCESVGDDGFNSFTVDLIHRDSPLSPTYNSSLTPSERLANSLKRSDKRILGFKNKISPQSPASNFMLDPESGEYIMKYSIGSPPFTTFGIADTGSDVTWTQCQPCSKCYKQKQPLFNPKRSSTYKTVPCSSNICRTSPEYTCSADSLRCEYSVLYGDDSFTDGELAMDTLTLGSIEGKNVSVPNFTFGCGHKSKGTFSPNESGIVGLGPGKPSLISQLGPSIRGKFSYCMSPSAPKNAKPSKLIFGANAVVSGPGVVSTDLKTSDFYHLTLEGISVGNQRLGFSNDPLLPKNNTNSRAKNIGMDIVIDSGTVLTYLPDDLYNNLQDAVESRIKLQRIYDPLRILRLCFKTQKDEIASPDVVFHFKGGDVKLKPENVFVRTGDESLCLAFKGRNYISIYGNIAQYNFLVGYDVEKGTVSFKPTDCSKA